MKRSIFLFTLLLLSASCSNQAWYEGFKAGQRQECMTYPEAAYRECIEDTEKSYDAYNREREQNTGGQIE